MTSSWLCPYFIFHLQVISMPLLKVLKWGGVWLVQVSVSDSVALIHDVQMGMAFTKPHRLQNHFNHGSERICWIQQTIEILLNGFVTIHDIYMKYSFRKSKNKYILRKRHAMIIPQISRSTKSIYFQQSKRHW